MTLIALALLWAAGACGGPSPARSLRVAPAPGGTVLAPAVGTEVAGTRDTAAARIVGVAYGPSRLTFEFSQPAYLTVISVTTSAIEPIIPAIGVPQSIVQRGLHVVHLNRLDSARYAIADEFSSAGALSEYNRCLANARLIDARNREARRPVVGTDSAGRPIYGPPDMMPDPRRDAEARCRPPVVPSALAADRVQAPVQGRILLLFASDTKIAYRDVVELAISEGDPRSITEAVGRRLFGIRGAQWSGSFVPW